MEYKINNHTVEIRYSPTGSYDPWTLEYADELGVSLLCTADVANFALVDGDTLYRLKGGEITFQHYVENKVFDKPEMFEMWLDEISERKFGSLKESKARIDNLKKRTDEYNAMSPEEKEEYKRKWREERDKRIVKLKKTTKK